MNQKRPGGTAGGMRTRHTGTRPRQGVASRELQEARRRRRQREVKRNRIIFGAICLTILALLLFVIIKGIGMLIGAGATADVSTITFQQSGKVVFEEVVDFDTDTYSKSDLRSNTKDLISSFNDTYGDKAIVLDKIKFKNNQAYIKTTYKDAEAYSAFTSYQTYNASYEDAVKAGYDFKEVFCSVADSKKSKAQTVDADSAFKGSQVAIIKENVTVVVPGQIKYVSDPSTTVVAEDTVSIKPSDGNEDATDLVYIIYKAK